MTQPISSSRAPFVCMASFIVSAVVFGLDQWLFHGCFWDLGLSGASLLASTLYMIGEKDHRMMDLWAKALPDLNR